jgi:molybdate transport system substrate-binding protein
MTDTPNPPEPADAPAPELRIVSSMATRRVLADMIERLASESTQRVAVESVGGVKAAERVRAGEPFDVVVLASDVIDDLMAAGHVVPGSRVDIVRSAIVVAVRRGAAHPDLSSADAVKSAVLAARSIGYSTGPSGGHLAKLFKAWGIAETLQGRITVAPPGVPVGSLVARGDIELGFQQLSEFLDIEEIEVVGTLPESIQHITTFSGGIAATSTHAGAARTLLQFFARPEVADIKRRNGMEPA